MNKNKDIRYAIVIMVGSLLLLGVFISLWLQRVYTDEYENLQRDTDFLFITAIRDLESELMFTSSNERMLILAKDSAKHSFWVNDADSNQDDFFINSGPESLEIHVNTILSDSLLDKHGTSVVVVSTGEMEQVFPRKPSTPSTIPTKFSAQNNEFKGTLSLFIDMGLGADSLQLRDSTFMINLIRQNVGDKFKSSSCDLPSKFDVFVQKERNGSSQAFSSKRYTDLITDQSFALELEEYKPFIIKKMWQEIAFSLLLLLSVAFSFWFIYRSMKRQNRLTELKNNLIRNITHELKTPITTVGVAIEALDSFDVKNNPDRLKEYLDISKHELNRLSVLIDKVLNTSLFDKKEDNLNFEAIDFEALVRGVIDSMKVQFEKLDASVSYRVDGTNFTKNGDAIHLTNVVYNLLENALKYSKGKPEIEVFLKQKNDRLLLAIMDRGIGIPNQYLEKIFEDFFRVPTGDQHDVKGHGLGLAYVANVIRKHGGKITAENRKEGGVIFKIDW